MEVELWTEELVHLVSINEAKRLTRDGRAVMYFVLDGNKKKIDKVVKALKYFFPNDPYDQDEIERMVMEELNRDNELIIFSRYPADYQDEWDWTPGCYMESHKRNLKALSKTGIIKFMKEALLNDHDCISNIQGDIKDLYFIDATEVDGSRIIKFEKEEIISFLNKYSHVVKD